VQNWYLSGINTPTLPDWWLAGDQGRTGTNQGWRKMSAFSCESDSCCQTPLGKRRNINTHRMFIQIKAYL